MGSRSIRLIGALCILLTIPPVGARAPTILPDADGRTPLDAPTDGSAWGRGICSSHTTRGGSWVTGSKESRLPARFNLQNGDRNDFTGFRVVRDIDE